MHINCPLITITYSTLHSSTPVPKLSKIGEITSRYHRTMPSPATILTTTLSHVQTLLLLAKLEALLPYTIPLARRIQCHLRQPRETSAVILSTTREVDTSAPEELDVIETIDEWLSLDAATLKAIQTPWLASFIDLTSPGTTQGWVFGSWEQHPPELASHPASTYAATMKQLSSLHKELVHSLFAHIHSTLVPAMPLDPPESWCWLRDNGKWVSQPYSRAKVLFGTLHEGVRSLIDKESVARIDAEYDKWIFGPETLGDETMNGVLEEKGLLEGYVFETLDDGELQTVLDGTPIPRLLGYLKEVVNAGVYYRPREEEGSRKGELVAYAFVGKDGSLSSLEVKKAHRGKGLAGQLSRELFRRQADTFSLPSNLNGFAGSDKNSSADKAQGMGREQREGWFSHADVGVDNTGSKRVMDKLGGKIMWRVCWVEVDLDVVMGTKDRAREEGDGKRFNGEERFIRTGR